MKYQQAKMIIWNAETYNQEQIKEAVAHILGTLGARSEDIRQASSLYEPHRNDEPTDAECAQMGGGADPLYGQRMDSADMGEN